MQVQGGKIMKTLIISNAFSLNMIPQGAPEEMYFKLLSLTEVKDIINKADEVVSIVGHADTARVFSNVLGTEVTPNRVTWQFDLAKHPFAGGDGHQDREKLLVGQYTGPRLPEGATELPKDANIKWYLIDFFKEFMPI
jgi:hypothetical protein